MRLPCLRRAVALFTRAGFTVFPVGADYRSLDGCRRSECWLPKTEALEATALALKEFLGYWVQVTGLRFSESEPITGRITR
ncbi:hypothetical protein [uncultured Lamprocystis sp.]|jgi:uncharacterized SAM-binding protein YcdF (DUF218 family)|uniref:hypothetical protein n=1 Tax=uncultured Lamprocystis sp. TaxID=543132 RepID=UPI0025E4964A|nr:hypothetical protein [uncultured Lamprocystis sp.]